MITCAAHLGVRGRRATHKLTSPWNTRRPVSPCIYHTRTSTSTPVHCFQPALAIPIATLIVALGGTRYAAFMLPRQASAPSNTRTRRSRGQYLFGRTKRANRSRPAGKPGNVKQASNPRATQGVGAGRANPRDGERSALGRPAAWICKRALAGPSAPYERRTAPNVSGHRPRLRPKIRQLPNGSGPAYA